MDRNTKEQIVTQLKEDLNGVNTVFLCDFKGLSVEKDTLLRRNMRDAGNNYSVVKNTLLKLAFNGSDLAAVEDHLKGNTALAYTDGDVVGLAKMIRDFAKSNEAFNFKAGVVEGKVIDMNGLETLASLPSKEELIAKLMYMLNYPIQGLATALAGIPRNFVVVLDQIKKQKEENQ